jgi:hypothetical protein
MYFWLLVDLIIGLVPFVGDIADALILANTRNAAALEEHLRQKGKKNLRASGQSVPASDPSDPAEFDRLHTESTGTAGTPRPPRRDNGSTNLPSNQHPPQTSGVASVQSPLAQPAPARVQEGRQSRGFFSFGSKKSRPTDVESGLGAAGQNSTTN